MINFKQLLFSFLVESCCLIFWILVIGICLEFVVWILEFTEDIDLAFNIWDLAF